MKKSSKLLALILVLALALSMALAGCTGGGKGNKDSSPAKEYKELTYAKDTVLRMSAGYDANGTGISFTSGIAEDGKLLADGVTYKAGDLKPTWVQIQKELNVKFDDKFNNEKTDANYKTWKDQLDQIDVLSITASQANETGATEFVNIADYLDYMPNFDKYLNDNPIVKLSIMGSTAGNGAIYFSPYFDGSDDIERMPLMRTDWVAKLLNGDGEFTATTYTSTSAPVYTPYMPTTGSVQVDVVKASGTGTEKVTKDYSKYGNIIAKMNEKGTMTGVEAVNMLRTYIDQTYNGYYGTNRADLFIGQNAAWDADEMVALLRCVVANSATVSPEYTAEKEGNNVVGLFSREDNNNQRRVDLFRFAGSLFGVRGLESRQDYLYFGKDGKLHDARNSVDTYEAIERMNAMFQEGLISADYGNDSASNATNKNYIPKNWGFMSYDYNQTQTLWSTDTLQYRAVLVPVAKWYDGTNNDGVYMRFTESWRSVKTDCWAISKAGVAGNQDKLFAALKLIDWAYSMQGQITMSYGPDAFIKVKDASVVVKTKEDVAKKYETFKFNGEDWPLISDGSYQSLQTLTGGNYTDYARLYLGSTISFLKSQAFEVQCTTAVGKQGAALLSNAIAAGIIKHPLLKVNTENMWYTSVPTVLPTTSDETTTMNNFTNISGSSSKYSFTKKQTNILVDMIKGGYAAVEGISNKTEAVAKANEWGVQDVLAMRNHVKENEDDVNGPWQRLLEYYNRITA